MISFQNIVFGTPFNRSNKRPMSLLDTIERRAWAPCVKHLRFSIVFKLKNFITVHPFGYIQVSAVHSYCSIYKEQVETCHS